MHANSSNFAKHFIRAKTTTKRLLDGHAYRTLGLGERKRERESIRLSVFPADSIRLFCNFPLTDSIACANRSVPLGF